VFHAHPLTPFPALGQVLRSTVDDARAASEACIAVYADFIAVYADFIAVYAGFIAVYAGFIAVYADVIALYADVIAVYTDVIAVYADFIALTLFYCSQCFRRTLNSAKYRIVCSFSLLT
jgi:hypothetical protein